MKILSVVGTRPEFIQAMPVGRAIRIDHQEILVHTGQHYDYLMYQKFFDEYNQIVAQVLLPSDIISNKIRVEKTRNTLETLLEMNIIPIINENDAVSTTDIELDDNYPLALNVAKMVNADIILLKFNANGKFLIIPKGQKKAILANNEYALFEKIKELCSKNSVNKVNKFSYPSTVDEIVY